MLNWIMNNKEWLFAGAGIILIVEIYKLFMNNLNKKESKVPVDASVQVNTHVSPNINVSPSIHINLKDVDLDPQNNAALKKANGQTSLTATEIGERLANLPPFQKEDALKHYIGLSVDWEMDFSSAKKNGEDLVRVILNNSGKFSFASFSVKLSEYPEIKVMLKAKKIRVQGKINSIDSGATWFELEDVVLTY
jgi:hypothetical protein